MVEAEQPSGGDAGERDAAVLAALRRAGVDGEVVDAASDRYETARRVWNGVCDRRPAAVVRPASRDGVVRTIGAAREVGALLAVRCGGHSFPGFSTCDGGIVLDLAALRSIETEPGAHRALVGGGALLGDVDRATLAAGLVVPAGVVSHTGAGGLTLGGGMGWLSRRFGLTIDSLEAAEVCTADGRVLRASAGEEPELFWALRGGGGNFGVVTRFSFRLHELGPVHAGVWSYPPDRMGDVLAGFHELAAAAPRELTAAFTSTAGGTRVTALSSGASRGAAQAVSRFGALGTPRSGAAGPIDFGEFQRRSDDHFAWGRRYYAKGGFLADLSPAAIEAMVEAVATAPTPDSEVYVLQLGGAVDDVAEAETAYTGRGASYYWIVEPVWDDPADDGRCIAWGRSSAARLAALSAGGNYVNEQSDVGVAITRGAYDTATYERLLAVKRRLDPDNLFRLNHNIDPGAT